MQPEKITGDKKSILSGTEKSEEVQKVSSTVSVHFTTEGKTLLMISV